MVIYSYLKTIRQPSRQGSQTNIILSRAVGRVVRAKLKLFSTNCVDFQFMMVAVSSNSMTLQKIGLSNNGSVGDWGSMFQIIVMKMNFRIQPNIVLQTWSHKHCPSSSQITIGDNKTLISVVKICCSK